MADPKPISRDELAKFLPSARAIKAFEDLFEIAGETTPDTLEELLALVNSIKNRDSGVKPRLEELEQAQPRIMNLSDLENRLQVLETQLSKRDTHGDLLRRIEQLEQLLGV